MKILLLLLAFLSIPFLFAQDLSVQPANPHVYIKTYSGPYDLPISYFLGPLAQGSVFQQYFSNQNNFFENGPYNPYPAPLLGEAMNSVIRFLKNGRLHLNTQEDILQLKDDIKDCHMGKLDEYLDQCLSEKQYELFATPINMSYPNCDDTNTELSGAKQFILTKINASQPYKLVLPEDQIFPLAMSGLVFKDSKGLIWSMPIEKSKGSPIKLTLTEANQYCEDLTKKFGLKIRLPSVVETRTVLNDFKNPTFKIDEPILDTFFAHQIWLSTPSQKEGEGMYYNSINKEVLSYNKNSLFSFVCILDPN